MKGLPQNVHLNFRLEFPKSDLTIYVPSGISKIFCQMVSTPPKSHGGPMQVNVRRGTLCDKCDKRDNNFVLKNLPPNFAFQRVTKDAVFNLFLT